MRNGGNELRVAGSMEEHCAPLTSMRVVATPQSAEVQQELKRSSKKGFGLPAYAPQYGLVQADALRRLQHT